MRLVMALECLLVTSAKSSSKMQCESQLAQLARFLIVHPKFFDRNIPMGHSGILLSSLTSSLSE
jgi:hypothetical protein